MFECLGYITIIATVFYIVNYRLINNFKSYLILAETVKVLKILKIECTTGKTYPEILGNIGSKLYDKLDFADRKKFFYNLKADKKLCRELYLFFDRLGKRDALSEKEFISRNMEYFRLKADELKDYCDKNHKSGFIAGISAGLIIVIIMI